MAEVGGEQRSEAVRDGAPVRLGGGGGPKASWRQRRGSARLEKKRTWRVRSEPTGALTWALGPGSATRGRPEWCDRPGAVGGDRGLPPWPVWRRKMGCVPRPCGVSEYYGSATNLAKR
jgi:hypothetical protein